MPIEKISADAPESKSADIRADNFAKLKALFPDLVTEGKDGIAVDLNVLKQLVGDRSIAETEEKFGLNWHGKRKARQIALTPSTGTLRPCPKESEAWDTTQNLMIEGDNLEVLKLLQKSYTGKVKMIFIDPPYNTGKDFVYPDDFQDNIKNYLELTGQVKSGRKMVAHTEASGRLHTEWLSMMLPRLKLAQNLLRDDGVIFITIDDGEASNLRILLDDVFGAENFAASIAWKKRSSPDARDTIGSIHDWIFCYVKTAGKIKSAIGKMALSEERIGSYSNPDNDIRGDWASVDMTGMTGRATKDQYFKVLLPSGRSISPPEGRSWGLAEATFNDLKADNRIWFGKGGDNVPRIKKFLSESDGQVVPSLWDMSEVGSNDEAKKEANDLMGQPDVFDTPKPVRLLNRMLEIATATDSNAIVLDFFAGSGTTGHAVLAKNAADGGNRKFIIAQLPEPLDASVKEQKQAADFCASIHKPLNIAELTKERLRRAAKKIKTESPLFAGDLGFRVYKLDSSNIREWDPKRDDMAATLDEHMEHLKSNRSETDILTELLLKLGLDLCVPVEKRTLADTTVYSIGAGALFACLPESITRSQVKPLAQGILAWREELKVAVKSEFVFRDSAFADDVAKTNLAAYIEQNLPESQRGRIRSL